MHLTLIFLLLCWNVKYWERSEVFHVIYKPCWEIKSIPLLLLLLSRFSRVRLCATPCTAAHQAPPSLGFSRQEHWNGLPFPSPMGESEKWKGSCSVVSDSSRPHGLQPTRLLHPWDSPGKSTGVGRHCLLRSLYIPPTLLAAQHPFNCLLIILPWFPFGKIISSPLS